MERDLIYIDAAEFPTIPPNSLFTGHDLSIRRRINLFIGLSAVSQLSDQSFQSLIRAYIHTHLPLYITNRWFNSSQQHRSFQLSFNNQRALRSCRFHVAIQYRRVPGHKCFRGRLLIRKKTSHRVIPDVSPRHVLTRNVIIE